MSPFATLPDLCLLALFRQLPIKDQIDARKVCCRWNLLVSEVTRKRRSLTLLLGNASIKDFEGTTNLALYSDYKALKILLNMDGSSMHSICRFTSFNSLHMCPLNKLYTKKIATTFTATRELQVTLESASSSTVNNLAHLLELWSHQLNTFKLIKHGFDKFEKRVTARLFRAVNVQSALKQLNLKLASLPVPKLSIISQLEELYFTSSTTTPEEFTQWLQQFGEGNRSLARIEYESYFKVNLDSFLELNEHLRRCFTCLNIYFTRDPVPLCAHFSGLTTLRLSPRHISARHLFKHLATLHQLIHLYLDIESDFFSADDLEHLLPPRVKSVKALDLFLWRPMPVHQQIAKLQLAWSLPNVEVVNFAFFGLKCTECDIGDFRGPFAQAQLLCLGQLFGSLKSNCTKLRLISHSTEHVQGTAEEILAKCAPTQI